MTDNERSCLSYWFPKLRNAGLPVPRTEIIRTEANLVRMLGGELTGNILAFLAEIDYARHRIGHPCFLRTGQGAGKHEWKDTCYLPKDASTLTHVAALVEWSQMVDMMGLPTNVWAVREMLPTQPILTAFRDMPICREFRFFVDDARVECHHPYWPKNALAEGLHEIQKRWFLDHAYDALSAMPVENGVSLAYKLEELASAAGKAVGGRWSVDILETTRGWYITDMAPAELSFHWETCPNAPASSRG